MSKIEVHFSSQWNIYIYIYIYLYIYINIFGLADWEWNKVMVLAGPSADWKKEALKKIEPRTGFEPVPPRY